MFRIERGLPAGIDHARRTPRHQRQIFRLTGRTVKVPTDSVAMGADDSYGALQRNAISGMGHAAANFRWLGGFVLALP